MKAISEKELSNIPLTDEEYDLIRSYGGQLEHFGWKPFEMKGWTIVPLYMKNPAALVADVATDPNGNVLQEATAYL